MDQFASNTLRTLGIVVISIFVILASLALLLVGLCFGLIGGIGGSGHYDPKVVPIVVGAMAAAAVIIATGVIIVAKLAKGIVRESVVPPLRWNIPDDSHSYPSGDVAPTPPSAQPSTLPPTAAQPPAVPPTLPHTASVQPRPTLDVVSHLSPASRAAIQRLILAIVAQIATQVVPVIFGWRWARYSVPATFRPALLTTSISALASNVPYLVLLFSLLRRPGRRAFAYSLAIPSILILYGIFGSSALIFVLLRGTHSFISFLVMIPWALHLVIFYLAWKAIRLTGILPNPARIILSAVVVFLYYSLQPALLIFVSYYARR
jgi:hypothetical protein